jgi:hypothetical protein
MTPGGILAIWKRKVWKHVHRAPIDAFTLSQLIEQAKSLSPERFKRGESNGNHKLTTEIVQQIFALKGIQSSQVAADTFHISDTLVQNIWKKKAWKHIHNGDNADSITS